MDLTQDFNVKTFHVVADLQRRNNAHRGLVYLPQEVHLKDYAGSQTIYEYFFQMGKEFSLVPIKTRQSITEFTETLEEKFGICAFIWTENIISPFHATKKQAKSIIKDLRKNSLDYYESSGETKEYFENKKSP